MADAVAPLAAAKLLWGTRAGHRPRHGRGHRGRRAAPADGDRRRGAAPRRGARARTGRHLPGATAPLQLHGPRAERRPAAAEDDVRYAIVLDADGRVAAHSERPERVGLVLPGAVDRRRRGHRAPLVQEAITETARRSTTSRCRSWSGPPEVGHGARRPVSKQRMESADPPRPAGSSAASPWPRCCWAAWRRRWWPGGSRGRSSSWPRARRPSRAASSICASSPTNDDEIGRLAVAFNHMAGPAPPAAHRAGGRQRRAAPAARRAGRPQELHRQHPGLADQRHRHRRPRRARGHAQSGRRADDRLLRRRGDGPLLHRGLRRRPPSWARS